MLFITKEYLYNDKFYHDVWLLVQFKVFVHFHDYILNLKFLTSIDIFTYIQKYIKVIIYN